MTKKTIIALSAAAMLCGSATWAFEYSNRQKLVQAEAAIAQLYVDTVNEGQLVEDAIRGMLKSLDPHSSYSTPEETRELNEPLEGNFSGIGIQFNMIEDTLYVIQTISGGPSERVGLLAGDRIVAVNDTAIAGVKMKNRDIMKRLRGPKGTDVNVKVVRQNAAAPADTIPFRITRDDIPIKSVDAAYMANDSVGYVRLNKFAQDTHRELAEAMFNLKRQGMRHMILDLTDNGGGYLEAATGVLGEFLPEDVEAVYMEGTNSPRRDFHTRPIGPKPLLEDGRLVVMANQFSASAAEITAGAIQDHDRGLIVGRRTFGKGLVQKPLPFPDGSMIRLTVAHYYTPSGRDIQKPYVKGEKDEYDDDINARLKSGELMHADSIHFDENLKRQTLRLGRTVYGGGGINPDIFVPLDTTENTRYYRQVMAKGLFNKFAIKYIDQNREQVKKMFPTDNAFIAGYQITPEMLQELYDMATSDGIEFNEEQANMSAKLTADVLKALIGRDIYGDQSYFKIWNLRDPIFLKALEAINDPKLSTLTK